MFGDEQPTREAKKEKKMNNHPIRTLALLFRCFRFLRSTGIFPRVSFSSLIYFACDFFSSVERLGKLICNSVSAAVSCELSVEIHRGIVVRTLDTHTVESCSCIDSFRVRGSLLSLSTFVRNFTCEFAINIFFSPCFGGALSFIIILN